MRSVRQFQNCGFGVVSMGGGNMDGSKGELVALSEIEGRGAWFSAC